MGLSETENCIGKLDLTMRGQEGAQLVGRKPLETPTQVKI